MQYRYYYKSIIKINGNISEYSIINYFEENYPEIQIIDIYVEDYTNTCIDINIFHSEYMDTKSKIAKLIHDMISNQYYIYDVRTEEIKEEVNP